jgi:hypothetical protein
MNYLDMIAFCVEMMVDSRRDDVSDHQWEDYYLVTACILAKKGLYSAN